MVPHKDDAKELARIKKNVENAWEYFRDNYERFNDMRKFVFISSMNDADESYNKTLHRPSIEFNILEAYINRLRGEFSKNEPGIEVSAKDGAKIDPRVISVVDGHLRYLLYEANKNGFEYNVYTDTLTGGFSSAKIYTDYVSEMSFNQDIFLKRTFDPTMTFFDPMAKNDDKGDGRFCGEVIPIYREEFIEQFPKAAANIEKIKVKSNNNVGNFQWSYKNQDEQVIVICDYYEKKKRKEKIVKLTDGRVMPVKEYKKLIEEWQSEGIIEQYPLIVGQPRMTDITTIVRYRICDTEILEYVETDYDSLPIVFIDGNSILSKDTDNTAVRQFTRPIIYQARGAQRLKNFAGQTLANELENLVQHKWMVPKEGIPLDYKEAYTDVQMASVLVYNAFKDDDPNIPLPPPQAVPRPPIPPEIINTFMGCDQIIQNTLGTFDPSLAKLGEREVSGIAIQESLTLSNASAMPYVVSFLKGLQSVANRIVEVLPKIYATPRTIPVMGPDGKKSYVVLNQEGGISLDYEKNALQVKIEAGPSFGMQQSKALNQIIALTQASPLFGQFINTVGLDVLLDNIDIRGIDQLKAAAENFMAQMQQMQAQAAQQKSQQDPNMMFIQVEQEKNQQKAQIEMAKLQQKAEQDKAQNQLSLVELEMEKQKLNIELAKLAAEVEQIRAEFGLKKQKQASEQANESVELALKAAQHNHKINLDEANKINKKIEGVDYEL